MVKVVSKTQTAKHERASWPMKDWEVRAILGGRKTQARRILLPKHVRWAAGASEKDFESIGSFRDGKLFLEKFPGVAVGVPKSPYGNVGDMIYGRETWTPDHKAFYPNFSIVYRADRGYDYERNEHGKVYSPEQKAWYPYRWRPANQMTRALARIWLEIVGVRVERLQGVSAKDAMAEGVEPGCLTCGENCIYSGGCGYCRPDYRDSFIGVWNSMHSPCKTCKGIGLSVAWDGSLSCGALMQVSRDCQACKGLSPWDQNPWVWVYEFKRVEKLA